MGFGSNFSLPEVSFKDLQKKKAQIAVVANEEAISYQAIVDRIKMAAFMSGMKENNQTYNYITNQIVRAMVDESIRFQAMKEHNVPSKIEDYQPELANVAKSKNMSLAQLKAAFKQRNIPFSSLEKQVITFSGWLDLAKAKYSRDLSVSEMEIHAERNQYILNAGKPEYLLAEIFLSSNGYKSDYELEQEGYRLLEEMNKGADFVSLARQFSDGAGAQRGGDMGWVLEGELTEPLNEALKHLQTGAVSVPIRDQAGYHLLLLRDKRIVPSLDPSEIDISYVKVYMPYDVSTDDYEKVSAEVNKYKARMTSCEVAKTLGEKDKKVMVEVHGTQKMSNLPAVVEAEVSVLPDQKASPLIMSKNALNFYMVCSRDTQSNKIPSVEEVIHFLKRKRLDMFQRRMFRDTFQASYIDVRM